MDNEVDQQPQGHPLFGGAFSAFLPPGSLDISEMRQVPDNQEVFVHPSTDQSIIVELLEYQGDVPDENAARYHFEDIAGASASAEILSQEMFAPQLLALEGCSSAWCLTARQLVSKFDEEAKNEVTLHLVLLRLPQYGTDLLLTFNNPTYIQLGSAHANPPFTTSYFSFIQSSKQQHGPRNRDSSFSFSASVDTGAFPHLRVQCEASRPRHLWLGRFQEAAMYHLFCNPRIILVKTLKQPASG